MRIEDHIQYWLDSAAHDWRTAVNLYGAGKYDWCLFIGHLVLEKTLKAIFVQNNGNRLPPKTHNLVKLAETFTEYYFRHIEEMAQWLRSRTESPR